MDAENSKGQFLMFEKTNQNQSDIYRCLTYSEAGLAETKISVEVISRLRATSTFYQCNRNTNNLTRTTTIYYTRETSRSILGQFNRIGKRCRSKREKRFFREIFSDNIELCLSDGEVELICDYFDDRKDPELENKL